MKSSYTIFCLAAAAILTSCGGDKAAVSVRDLLPEEQEFKLAKSTTERFRYAARETSGSGHEGHAHATKEGGPQLIHDIPEGWTEKPAAMMRDVNLAFGENGEGECYLSRLPGAGGGLEANVNRWRKQMGAEPLTPEAVQKLPKKTLFGQPATFVDVSGDYGGMSGTEGKKNYRMLGLVLSNSAGAVFVKLIGPKALVDANEKQFNQFVDSLDVKL